MTRPRRTRHQARSAHPSAGDKDPSETSEPYDLPYPEDQWPPGRPAYLIVVDQLRDWQPARHSPSLAELLESEPSRTREPDPEAEP